MVKCVVTWLRKLQVGEDPRVLGATDSLLDEKGCPVRD